MIDKIREWLRIFTKKGQGYKQKRYVILLVLTGVLLLLISNMFSASNKDSPQEMTLEPNEAEMLRTEGELEEVNLTTNVKEIESTYESDLKAMLNQINGVSEVEVMVNVDSTNEKIYEKDLIVGLQTTDESDKSGGTRKVSDEMEETKLVYVRQGDQEVPLLIYTKKPEVRGVFIIAKGAEDANVKKWIVESVSKVLDVPTYKISVMPK